MKTYVKKQVKNYAHFCKYHHILNKIKKAIMLFYHYITINYCPLVWMFRSRKSNYLINKVQEKINN